MATQPNQTPDPQARRAALRRARSSGGGFGAGGSTRLEGGFRAAGTSAEPDSVDDAIDPTMARYPAPAPRQAPPATDEGNNPRARLQSVQMAGSAGYAREYRLDLMARMLMRGVGLDVIAQQLQISITTAEKYRAELKGRFREDARKLNIDEMVGNSIAEYEEMSQMAMRIASQGGDNATPTPMRLAAIRTALAAKADKTRFLNSAGVFDVLRFRQAETETNQSDLQRLMNQTEALLAGLAEADDEPTPARPPRMSRARKPRKEEGFGGMSWEDRDASGSDKEVQEI